MFQHYAVRRLEVPVLVGKFPRARLLVSQSWNAWNSACRLIAVRVWVVDRASPSSAAGGVLAVLDELVGAYTTAGVIPRIGH